MQGELHAVIKNQQVTIKYTHYQYTTHIGSSHQTILRYKLSHNMISITMKTTKISD